MRHDLERRLTALEAKVKPRVISTRVDFMMLADDDTEVELSQELQELVDMVTQEEEAADESNR